MSHGQKLDSGVRRRFGVEAGNGKLNQYIAVAGYANHKSSYGILHRKIHLLRAIYIKLI